MTAIAVTIAGSDSGGGAGIQADLKTFSALKVFGASVITAVTAQNTLGVSAVHPIPGDIIKAQIDAVFSDLKIKAVKIGMLAERQIIETIANTLANQTQLPIILDPVMVATSGDPLINDDAVESITKYLIPLASLITPNLPEAARLLNCPIAQNETDMQSQAEKLLELGANAVLLKGGHGESENCSDLFIAPNQKHWLQAKRIKTRNTHGTGCTLSSAVAAGLAKGTGLQKAINDAKNYINGALKSADQLAIGSGNGPVHHFHDLWKEKQNG